MNLIFKEASPKDESIIFDWLSEPHIKEFWDNSQEHKDDILHFIHKRPQYYFAGTTRYWIGYVDDVPFAFLLSDILQKDQTDLSELCLTNMSINGHTISLDFGIGNIQYLGKGLAAQTLSRFVTFYQQEIDELADTFHIDPNIDNPKAIHVYGKAGFKQIGEYDVKQGHFLGEKSYLMVKHLER